MLFPTVVFAVFFLIVYGVRWGLASRPTALKRFLLVASYVFYGWWDWRFLGLIMASSVLNHVLAVAMARVAHGCPIGRFIFSAAFGIAAPPAAAGLFWHFAAQLALADHLGINPDTLFNMVACVAGVCVYGLAGFLTARGRADLPADPPPAAARRALSRRLLVIAAVALNLGFLGFFKYYGFLVHNAYALCARLGWPCSLPLLEIILPVGISFFTFQAMSYVLDVHRGDIAPAPSLLDFAVYLAFFPQLVAGPIVRARVFLPQLLDRRPPDRLDVGRAAILILGGLFKKVVVANYLAAALADPVFGNPSAYGAGDTLFAVYAYAIQIYCDFSAYSDIAIGTALLLGFRFPINFDAPYFATSIQTFWRRWHISLSSWLRDYLYIPLGGSRRSPARTYVNLLITFLLGGLWHGAGWTFIAWGLLHGLYLCVERWVHSRVAPSPPGRVRTWLAQALTFHLVCFSWIFFRAETFADARALLANFTSWTAPERLSTSVWAMLALGFATQALDGRRIERLWDAAARWPGWAIGLVAAGVLTCILGLGPRGVAPFIYFQF